MVNPIDYTMNVLNPVEGYMQGLKFGEGIQTDRLNRELAENQEGRAQETFAMQKEDRARAIQQQQAAAAARAELARKQKAQAEAGREMLFEYYQKQKDGTATPDDFRKAFLYFPEQIKKFEDLKQSFTDERLGNEVLFGRQVLLGLKNNSPEAVRKLLQDRRDASTDPGSTAAYESQLIMLDTDPDALAMEFTAPMTIIDKGFDDFSKNYLEGGAGDLPAEVRELQFRAEQGGLIPGTPEYTQFMISGGVSAPVVKKGFRAATSEEAANFGATSGQIDQDSGRFYPINPPKGYSLTVDKDGTFSFVEGAVAGVGETGKKSTDFVYTKDPETGQEIAKPIAGTPAALENEQRRSSVLSSIDTAETMLTTIESLVGREAKEGQTAIKAPVALSGILGLFEGNLPAKTQAQADLMAIYEQVTGQAFLDAFESLKGGGQITETEGIKATQARARLQRTQSPKVFKESLYEFSDIVRRGLKRAESELETISDIVPAPPAATAQPPAAVPDNNATNRFSSFNKNQMLFIDINQLSESDLKLWSIRMDELGL